MTTGVVSLIFFCSALCRFSHQFLSARPAHPDVLAHTPSNLSQEGGGSPASLPPPLHPRQGRLYLSFPLTHSLTHSPCLSHSLCFPTVVMLMAVMGSACQSPPPLHTSRRRGVITEQRRAEWPDGGGDGGLLTEVFVWPEDMCSHWHSGAGDRPHWAQTAVE